MVEATSPSREGRPGPAPLGSLVPLPAPPACWGAAGLGAIPDIVRSAVAGAGRWAGEFAVCLAFRAWPTGDRAVPCGRVVAERALWGTIAGPERREGAESSGAIAAPGVTGAPKGPGSGVAGASPDRGAQIGRASCRERGQGAGVAG